MKNVLLVAREMIPSVVLCGHAQLTQLSRAGRVAYRRVTPAGCTAREISWADVIVFIRSDDVFALTAAELARRAGKYGVYVLDDDLLHVPAGLASSLYYALPETRERIRAVMERCQCLLSPSPVLLEKYGGGFARAERIEEPALWALPALPAPEGPVRIGFAGSADRTGDIDAILLGALRRVRARYGDKVRLEFFGACPSAAKALGARCVPYKSSYADYRRTMGTLGWEIGLAPLPDTPFHRCKHYNKYVEYAAFGIAGVYSDGEVYRRAVRDGENGLLAANTEEAWFSSLCRLIEDKQLRRRIGRQCLLEAHTLYAVEAAAEPWERLVESAPEAPAAGGARLWLAWAALSARSLLDKLRAKGLRGTAAWVARRLLRPFRRGEERA